MPPDRADGVRRITTQSSQRPICPIPAQLRGSVMLKIHILTDN